MIPCHLCVSILFLSELYVLPSFSILLIAILACNFYNFVKHVDVMEGFRVISTIKPSKHFNFGKKKRADEVVHSIA